jgi:hypothetical protein
MYYKNTRVYPNVTGLASPGARTANGTALCHKVQLYRYLVSQSSELCRHRPLYCFSTSVYFCYLFRYDSVRKLLDAPTYVKITLLNVRNSIPNFQSTSINT